MNLDLLRKRIDHLDDEIVERLDERARVVMDVARAKQHLSAAVYDPVRERAVLRRLAARVSHLSADAVCAVYREVISACRALQQPIRVSYLGPEGTFSNVAARTIFGSSVSYVQAATQADVFDFVATGQADAGVVPLENSIGGPVVGTLESLDAGNVYIRAELDVEVSQCLLAHQPDLGAVERVYSHTQPLRQCRRWLAAHLPGATHVETASTAAGVREAVSDPRGAAIASRLASEIYGLPVVRERIHDHSENVTRFAVISRDEAAPAGNDRTAVSFRLTDGHGTRSLARTLHIFGEVGVEVVRLATWPVRDAPWNAVYFAELEGDRGDPAVSRALQRLREECTAVQFLGSWSSGAGQRSREDRNLSSVLAMVGSNAES